MFFPLDYGLDLLASFLLALAASVRASRYGMHFTGAVALGCLVGLVSPAARDMVLGFGAVSPLEDGGYTAAALAGAMAGKGLAAWCEGDGPFFWSDATSLGLATAVGAECGAMLGLQPVGAILLGLCAGTVGGLTRDICLGDVPRALEAEFYVTAAAMGCMLVVALRHIGMPGTLQILLAAGVVTGLRAVGRSRAHMRGAQE